MIYETVDIEASPVLERASVTQVRGHFFMIGSYVCVQCHGIFDETNSTGACVAST